MRTFRDWRFWIGLLLSGVFLFLAVRQAHFNEVASAFQHVNYGFVLLSIGCNLFGLWIRSFRWGFLLRSLQPIGMHSLFSSTAIGFMASNLLPVRIGELVRAYAIGRREKMSTSSAFATIVVERMFDGLTILLVLLVVVGFLKLPFPDWLRKTSVMATIGYFILLGILIFLTLRPLLMLRILEIILRIFPMGFRTRISAVVDAFLKGLSSLHQWKTIFMVSVLSPVLWFFLGLSLYFMFLASGIHLSISVAFFLLVVLCFGVALPSAPGYWGTVQLVSVLGLSLFGISKSLALGFSILYHLSQYIPVTVLGLIYFFAQGLSFSEIQKQKL